MIACLQAPFMHYLTYSFTYLICYAVAVFNRARHLGRCLEEFGQHLEPAEFCCGFLFMAATVI